jgi:hypothetical protein
MSRLSLAATLTILVVAQTALAQRPCDSLDALRVGMATITSSRLVPAGPHDTPRGPLGPLSQCRSTARERGFSDPPPIPRSRRGVAAGLGVERQAPPGGQRLGKGDSVSSHGDPLRRGFVTAGTDLGMREPE